MTDERESSQDPGTGVDPVTGVDEVREIAAAAHLEADEAFDGGHGASGQDEGVDYQALRAAEHRAHAIAGAIYGTILATTVVASLGHDPEKLAHSIAIVLFTSLVFWAAHVYSLMVAGRIVAGRKLTRLEVGHIALNEWPMLQSSLPVALPLVLGVVGLVDRDDAATIAMFVGIGALFFYGVLLGRREGREKLSLAWNAFVVGSFGVLILLLKIVVH